MKKHTAFIGLILFFATYSAAQVPKFRHLEVETGLPSATVYGAYQDSKDFLWFSTEAGLSRFDGVRFRNFSMDDGLPDNEIFGLFEDNRGRLWFRAFNGQVGFLKNGVVADTQQHPYLKALEQPHWVVHIAESAAGRLYFSQHSGGLSILSGKSVQHFGQLDFRRVLPSSEPLSQVQVLSCRVVTADMVQIFTNIGIFILKNNQLQFVQSFPVRFSEVAILNGTTAVAKSSSSNDLYGIFQDKNSFNTKKILPAGTLKLESDILILKEQDSGVWLGSLGEGLFLLQDLAGEPSIADSYLEGQSVSGVLKDKEDNLWITTLGNGVYMLPNRKVLLYQQTDGLSENDLYGIIGNDKGDIFVGTQHGNINHLRTDGSIEVTETALEGRRYNRISALALDRRDRLWIGSDVGLFNHKSNRNYGLTNVKSLALDAEDNLFVGAGNELYRLDAQGRTQKIWDKRVNVILPFGKNKAWLGTNNGLFLYDGNTVKAKNDQPLLRYRINDLVQTPDGTICICTAGNGVLLKTEKRVQQITKKQGLASNVCTDLFQSPDGRLWVATNRGITKFLIVKGEPQDFFSYNETEYLASNEVRGLFVKGDAVWASTSGGLSYIEGLNGTKKTLPPPTFYILGVKIRERDTTLQQEYILDYTQNDIKIEYTGISFRSGTQVRYRYKMRGLGDTWTETSSNEAHFPFLQSGDYEFCVKAISIDGKESAERRIRFVVRPPWWKRQDFRVGITVLGLLLFGGGLFYVIKNREDKMQLKRQISESERMALRAQMNPHFIFNALNSIQHFITMEDEVSANYYLSQFAKLIRRVLENSKQPLISLEDELTTLRLYLELEALRFEGKFVYEMQIDANIDAYDVELPSMIIQPFVENAIWHGLMPKAEGTPTLTLHFSRTDENLICEIRDNGIGRAAAAQVSKKNLSEHQSTGISNTMRRLSLMSKMEKKAANIEIVDLYENELPAGTLVVVKIPFLAFVD